MKGIIVRWVDDRGFGFINSEELDGDIFVHVSKFKKGYRRPQIGDQVEFQLVMGFSCQGKTYCSEMVSCNEAKFYLSNCPNVKIDGDNDGIPCESQFCGNW
ncbi:cold shock domain-containing protein [Vibrio parahaemolyticus]|nr:cold shock domain-containing protein [Vibrio parahaemolyticus]MCF9905958.1 cold shock domain-containing protein [Vibrio parahaemolyticus]